MSGLALAAAAGAGSITVFDGTGADLVADPFAVFPTQQPTVMGDSADWHAPIANQVLAARVVAFSGSYTCDAAPATITISVSLTRLSDDFDPVFVVGDGSYAVGGQIGDNPNGSARAIAGPLFNDLLTLDLQPLIFQNAGFPPIGGSLDALIVVTLRETETDVRVAFGTEDVTTTVSASLDRVSTLSFLLVANASVPPEGEAYRINHLTLMRSASTSCPGDADGDGDVDFADLNTLLGNFNTQGEGLDGDSDCDGDVDFGDLNTLLSVFNTFC